MDIDLWTYSLSIYSNPKNQKNFLMLQNEGFSICLFLCDTWLENCKISCTRERSLLLHETVLYWENMAINPLRNLRKSWNEPAKRDKELFSMRSDIKKIELDSEQVLLKRLEETSKNWSPANIGERYNWLEERRGSLKKKQCRYFDILCCEVI